MRDGTNNANGTVTPEEEIAYIQRAGEGDAQAFEFLYENYVHRIYNLVFRIVGTAGEAEEVTQEVFCQAFRGLAGFEGRSRFYTWIYRIATNLSVQHLQNNARIREFASLEDLAQVRGREAISSLEDPEKSVQKREFFQKLEDALGMLNPYHRTVLTLGPIQGHSHEEIGAILDLTPEVVKARLQRARAHLRELMNAYR